MRTEELLTACYTNPEAVHHLLDRITNVIIEFSRMQLELIGPSAALPGHLFPSGGRRGISISDDNCSMVSADIYRQLDPRGHQEAARLRGGGQESGQATLAATPRRCGLWYTVPFPGRPWCAGLLTALAAYM